MKLSPPPAVSETAEAYHQIRFVYDKRRAAVWRAITRYLETWVHADEGLLELGAGYGEFSSEVHAAQKWALDLNPALVEYWDRSVTPLITICKTARNILHPSLKSMPQLRRVNL